MPEKEEMKRTAISNRVKLSMILEDVKMQKRPLEK